jgi:hypothetical protein
MMDEISWADLTASEQHAIAVLGAGMSIGLCDPFAIATLRRFGLVRGSRLTSGAERLRTEAILRQLTR